jgi:hypothetical protein
MPERLAYHQQTLDYLKSAEPELWAWFSSTPTQDDAVRTARLEVLKSCYRYERADAADLYAVCDEVAATLDVTAPVTLYQSQAAAGMNLLLAYVPNEAHIVFEGNVRAMLTACELRAALAHELAHFAYWQEAAGEMLIADQMLAAMALHPAATPSHIESARLFRLYTEIHADRGALAVSGDALTAVSALIKIATGTPDVSAESYLRQAAELFDQQKEIRTEELTHPEAYIRVWALKRWADDEAGADADIRRIIEGRLDTERLSLIGQQRLTAITRRLLDAFFEPQWLRTDALLAHARLFFTDFNPGLPAIEQGCRSLADELADVDESVQRYSSYVLLDLGTVDSQLEDAPLAAAFRLADELGLGERFATLAREELALTKRAVARLKKEATAIMAKAAAAAEELT